MKHWANMGYGNIFFKKIPSKTQNKRLTLGITTQTGFEIKHFQHAIWNCGGISFM